MSKKLVLSVFLMMLVFMSYSLVNAASIPSKDGTYIVKYGSTIEIENGVTILKSSNENIAKVSGQKVLINGSGRFTLSVSLNGKTRDVKFFAWNAYLKNGGRYFTYKDSGGYHNSGNVLYSDTFLAVTKENRCFKINDYVFYTNGKYSTGKQLIGMYLGYFYNASSDSSSSRYFEYSLKKNDTVYKISASGIVEMLQDIKVQSIELNKTKITLKVGESETLIATVKPSDATNKKLSWSSSNTDIAKVVNGKVTAVKKGTVVVTATSTDGSNKRANCVVIVKESRAAEKAVLRLLQRESKFDLDNCKNRNCRGKAIYSCNKI